jgi:hypothetical protein
VTLFVEYPAKSAKLVHRTFENNAARGFDAALLALFSVHDPTPHDNPARGTRNPRGMLTRQDPREKDLYCIESTCSEPWNDNRHTSSGVTRKAGEPVMAGTALLPYVWSIDSMDVRTVCVYSVRVFQCQDAGNFHGKKPAQKSHALPGGVARTSEDLGSFFFFFFFFLSFFLSFFHYFPRVSSCLLACSLTFRRRDM